MISVQNRLPEPGKENRVSITPDSGSPLEGVLAYADDATQEGTFWNRKTAQLLQGDIRTYPVREGQSISAGDVVNVGQEVVSGTTYGDLAVGSTIQINENGSPVDYIVVHQGNPDPDLYDASCDGTWLLRKDIAENRVWDAGDVNQYASSDINAYLNGDWLDRYDSTTLGNIKEVKIPYCVGNGSETVNSGANGLSVKAFLLGCYEVGWSADINSGMPEDGAKLDYFIYGTGSEANQKRRFPLNGSNSVWTTRSPFKNYTEYVLRVGANGAYDVVYANASRGILTCVIFNSSALTGDSIVYGPETVYKDVVPQDNVENVVITNSVDATSICKLNEQYSVLFLHHTGTTQNQFDVYLIDNNTGAKISSSEFSASNFHDSLSVIRLDDSHFVVEYEYGEYTLSFKVGTLSGTSITFGSQFNSASGSENPRASNLVSLDSTHFFAAKCTPGVRPGPVTGRVYEVDGTEISPVGTMGEASGSWDLLSACRLPDDASGNKRVCICFSDTGDGNKGKAVIATIDSSNAVTFGGVVTVRDASVSYTGCAYADGVIYFFTGTYLYALSETLSTLGENSLGISMSTGNVSLVGMDDRVIAINGGGSAVAIAAKWNGSAFDRGDFYYFNTQQQAKTPSGAAISDNEILLAYADNGNSSYGTTTILTVKGNQIAGSFLDNSSDAIALADGTGGQEIPVGFGGYCECPGVAEGETIDSSGVWAYAVQDGWLDITAAKKRPVFGTYMGDGTYGAAHPTVIDVGFTPSMVVIVCNNTDGNFAANGTNVTIYRAMTHPDLIIDGTSCDLVVTFTGTGISFYVKNQSNARCQMNENSRSYDYMAWR